MNMPMINALTERMSKVEKMISDVIVPDMTQAKAERLAMKADTEEILEFVSGAKKAGSIAVRFGPRLAMFGAGIFTAAGFGNPNVWAFITTFFGG